MTVNETETIILCICICIALGGGGLLLASVYADARDDALDTEAEARADEESVDRAVADVRVLLREEIAQHATNAEFQRITSGLHLPEWPTS